MSETEVGFAGATVVGLRTGEILDSEASLGVLLTGGSSGHCDVSGLDYSVP